MKQTYPFLLVVLLFFFGCKKEEIKQLEVYGWNILTDHISTGFQTLDASENYKVNQLQLSEQICEELRNVKHQWNRNIINNLTEEAHDIGIPEVLVWDKAFYYIDYYPERFKVNGRINLDNRDFWEWLVSDYEKMLDKIPDVNGIVLTLNDTETKVEEQHSEVLNSPEQKLATFVDSLANLIINKRNLSLYLRYPIHSEKDVEKLISFLNMIETPGIKFMANGLSNPNILTPEFSGWVEKIPLPTIIDIDCVHKNEGQGNVASIFPELHLKQWKFYKQMPNVVGFSLKTDQEGKTSILDRPAEINMFAVYEAARNPEISPDSVLYNYLYQNYDSLAVPYLYEAFQSAPEILASSFYTLGVNTTEHSQINFSYKPSFIHKTSLTPSEDTEVVIQHGVDKTFRYWSEVVNHLAPADFKTSENENLAAIPNVAENNWLQPEELMDTTYLNYILTEKRNAINLAFEAISKINSAKLYCSDFTSFNRLYHTFNRTLITAKLRKAYAQVYYAERIWNRGKEFQNKKLQSLIQEGITELEINSEDIRRYRRKGPDGSYYWKEDAEIAMRLVQKINNSEILQVTFDKTEKQ